MQFAFLVIFGVGLALLAVTFILGEIFDFGDHGDLGADPSPLSSRVIFVFATAFGGCGFIGTALDYALPNDKDVTRLLQVAPTTR